VDGESQPTNDAGARGRIVAYGSNDYAHYAMGDAHAAYKGRLERFDRHVIYLRPRDGDEAMVVIVDDLASPKPARFQWWLHALEEMKVDNAHASVTIQRGAARLRVQFLAPSGLRLEQTGKFPVPPNEEVRGKDYPDQWHLTAHADEPATRRQFVTVLLPFREGGEGALPSVRLLEDRAVELRTARARHVVTLRNGVMKASATGERAGSLEVRY
jgi:hypothetical protein